jgi:hypothetical protein
VIPRSEGRELRKEDAFDEIIKPFKVSEGCMKVTKRDRSPGFRRASRHWQAQQPERIGRRCDTVQYFQMVAWALNNRESGFYAFPGSDHHDAEVRRERCACCISFDEDPGLLPKS